MVFPWNQGLSDSSIKSNCLKTQIVLWFTWFPDETGSPVPQKNLSAHTLQTLLFI